MVAGLEDSPARLADYDDSGWRTCEDLTLTHSSGFTFAWYRIRITLPETVYGRAIAGSRCLFETNIDDYGEVWVDGEIDTARGSIQGFNAPQRVVVTTDPQPGQQHIIALLAVNGPIGRPGSGIFVRYAHLAFEWSSAATSSG